VPKVLIDIESEDREESKSERLDKPNAIVHEDKDDKMNNFYSNNPLTAV